MTHDGCNEPVNEPSYYTGDDPELQFLKRNPTPGGCSTCLKLATLLREIMATAPDKPDGERERR